ncbi:MAG: ASCH domain-containing protein [Acidimicrobiales bacterium]
MLFEQRYREAIADGSVTLTFRRWRRRQVVAGHRYRTAAGRIEVESVEVVEPSSITDAEARQAGAESAAALLTGLRGPGDRPLYRVRFHAVAEPDPRDELAATDDLSAADVVELDRRLDRLDRASSHGPWSAMTLALIAARPGVRAGDLAESVGRERDPFKLDVRKLKALGLTISLEVGYRLSPRGLRYLEVTTRG